MFHDYYIEYAIFFEYITIALAKKPVILIDNYTFAQTTNDKRYWNCSYLTKKYLRRLPKVTNQTVYEDIQILGSTRTFNLPYEEELYNKVKLEKEPKPDLSYKFIKVINVKRQMLLLGNHTFAQTTSDRRYWNCSSKSRKHCTAKLRFDLKGNIVYYNLRHNHLPPRFLRRPDGEYAKVKN
ncbi:uncharacterized protein LOC123869104 [Maniola jurtina]|uniref:uncharacterized protein LOC123869104 n=1 Tax=Maniola jurtina TaxID=191418 RepID=UPI001E68E33F|nr:uncharacterized protein LOC123869104 [Maniola jurtina]